MGCIQSGAQSSGNRSNKIYLTSQSLKSIRSSPKYWNSFHRNSRHEHWKWSPSRRTLKVKSRESVTFFMFWQGHYQISEQFCARVQLLASQGVTNPIKMKSGEYVITPSSGSSHAARRTYNLFLRLFVRVFQLAHFYFLSSETCLEYSLIDFQTIEHHFECNQPQLRNPMRYLLICGLSRILVPYMRFSEGFCEIWRGL